MSCEVPISRAFVPLPGVSRGNGPYISPPRQQFVFPRSGRRQLRVAEFSLFIGQVFFFLSEPIRCLEMELVETPPGEEQE